MLSSAILALAILLAGPAASPAAAPAASPAGGGQREDTLPPRLVEALAGAWDAQGGGAPGKGAGTVEFSRALGDRAVVRRNVVTYPAADGKPASTHEDLLVIHAEGGTAKALYLDSEGHVIRYSATPGAPDTLVLVSDPGPGPRFRLTHDWSAPGALRIAFEIAAPGTTEFRTYAEGRATRRAR